MATADDVLAVEREWLGYDRWLDPEQGTVFGRWYAQVTGDDDYAQNGVAYCVMFQSYCFAQAGKMERFFPASSCDDVRNRAAQANRLVDVSDARVGDLLLFDWGDGGILDHIAIVERVLGAGRFQTIEGNTDGGKVKRRERYASSVRYVVRPTYDGEGTHAKTPTTRIDVDGVWGIETTNALRADFGLVSSQHVTSQWVGNMWRLGCCFQPCWQFIEIPNGDELIAEIQRHLCGLGMYHGEIDGICGIDTIGAMQEWMDVPRDYFLDMPSETVWRLQRRHNDGALVS